MNIATRLIDYIKGSYHELRKVVWPTKQQVIRNTILVIVISLGVAAFLGGVDYILNLIIESILI